MTIGTRLLLPLLAVVAVVMGAYGAWMSTMRERTLTAEAEREIQAYARALAIGVEQALASGDTSAVHEIATRIAREPKIYGIIVYDAAGRPLAAAAPLSLADGVGRERLRPVLESGSTFSFRRTLADEELYSVLRPIRGPAASVVGALEASEPLTFVRAEIARTRQRALLATLALLGAITLLLLWLVREVVTKPLEHFLGAVRALGHGNLSHRIVEPRGGELAELAGEFNRMAGHLQAARAQIVQDAEERVALERRLRETEKLAAVGNLAAGLAHEIAAPLQVVGGRAELLLRSDLDSPARERNLRSIADQSRRIAGIVRNLLDYARPREPKLQPVDLGAVLDGVTEFVAHELERAQVRAERAGVDSAIVRGDPHLLHQVFLNLVLNALQAVEGEPEENRWLRLRLGFEAGAGPAEQWVTAVVEDGGPGIPPDLRERIFDPFFTTKPVGAGTGLGLAVAAGIVREHGGRIEADAATTTDDGRPRGGCVRLYLPALATAAAGTAAEEAHA